MNVAKKLLVVTAAGALLAGITGCTSGGSGEALSPEDAWKNSPLSQYMNAGYDFDASPEEQQAESNKKQMQVEELVAECMSKEGFEYKPVDYSTQGGMAMAGEDVEWEPDKKEWVAQYGYGVFNNPYQSVQSEEPPTEENTWVDPNQEYVESLTESERTVYYETLSGPQPTEEEMNDPEFEWKPENMGCQGAAQQEVWGEMNVAQADEFKPLMDAVNKFYEQFYGEGAKVSEADKAWADCFAEAGYSGFERQGEAIQSFYDRSNKFYEDANPSAYATPATEGGEMSEEEFVDPSTTPEWKQAAEEEIETALADLECRQKTDYAKKQQDSMFAAEQKFVDEHKAELEAYKAAMEQAAEKTK